MEQKTNTEKMALLKSLVIDRDKKARFAYYCSGSLYYEIEADGKVYQFPVNVDDKADIGTATFDCEIKCITLMRYIRKAIGSENLIDVTLVKK